MNMVDVQRILDISQDLSDQSIDGDEIVDLCLALMDLREALTQLVHLHICEMEGIKAGQPSPTDWMKAVGVAEAALGNIPDET